MKTSNAKKELLENPEWKILTIEDIVDVNPTINKREISDDLLVSFVPMSSVGAGDGSIDVNNARNFSEFKKGFTPFLEDDVLFAKITPCMENGKMVVVPKLINGYGFGSTEFHVLRAKENIDPKYVYYFVSSHKFRNHAGNNMSGAVGQKRVPTKFLKEQPIPVPPYYQQKQIVAKIEELFSHIDAGIAALKKSRQLLKQYRQSVLKAAVTGELTKEWREQNAAQGCANVARGQEPEATKAKLEPASKLLERIQDQRKEWASAESKSGNGEARRILGKLNKKKNTSYLVENLPAEWGSASLIELCHLVVDCHNKTAPYVDDGIPLVRTSNIKNGEIIFDEKMRFINQETYDYWAKRCPPEPGDILFTREAPMGESAIIPNGVRLCMGQRMMLFRVFHNLTEVNYLQAALMSMVVQQEISELAVGVGVQHLRVGDVESLVVPVPPLMEQIEIVRLLDERLAASKRLADDLDVKLAKAERLKQSVLQSAFGGNLSRV